MILNRGPPSGFETKNKISNSGGTHDYLGHLVLFFGAFLLILYGLAEYLLNERKTKKYLKKLMLHNQLLHKLKTNSGYITALFILHFCALFYFSFQTISTMIAEDEDILFPYDLMCIADDDDDDFFAELEENYDVEMTTYPMVRVTSFDSTEGQDSMYQAQTIQGQHIGISESTYHALKKNWILLMKQKI